MISDYRDAVLKVTRAKTFHIHILLFHLFFGQFQSLSIFLSLLLFSSHSGAVLRPKLKFLTRNGFLVACHKLSSFSHCLLLIEEQRFLRRTRLWGQGLELGVGRRAPTHVLGHKIIPRMLIIGKDIRVRAPCMQPSFGALWDCVINGCRGRHSDFVFFFFFCETLQ